MTSAPTALVLCAAVMTLGACGRNSPMTIDAGDAGRTLRLHRGQELVVRLPANPTTGFQWVQHGGSGSVLDRVSGPTYTPDHQDVRMVGAGGTDEWRYRAARIGEQVLRFEHRRPWSTGPGAQRTVTWTITCR